MPKPIRVLHVVGAMNHGGVESFLMALLRHADRAEIAMDFLVHTSQPAAYDSEIAARGGSIIACPSIHRPGYILEFDSALRRHGPYDVLHSHVHYFSGVTTTLARRRGVRVRIAHSHTAGPGTDTGPLRAAYQTLMRRSIFSSATHFLAVSGAAGCSLFGADWRRHSRARLVHGGVDFEPFGAREASVDRESVRREFGIGSTEIVAGHVGNLHPVKNHAFLSSIAGCMTRRQAGVCVLSVGSGPLLKQAQAQFREQGVRAIFAGKRNDVPRLLRAMDVFVFPSLYEGLPLSLVEAQAAGLPCVVSDAVTQEVDVVPGLIRWLPLTAGPGVWADAVLEAAARPAQSVRGLAVMRGSPFNAKASFEQMCSIYCT